MPKGLTKGKWADLKEVLLHVPIKARNLAWKDAMDLVEHILRGRNNLAPNLDMKELKFSVECNICKELIAVDEDYVRHALTGTYVHYDCHHRSTGNIGESA
jgi:hypothetical protein